MQGISKRRLSPLEAVVLVSVLTLVGGAGPCVRSAQAIPVVCTNCSQWVTQILEYGKAVLEYSKQLEQYATQLRQYQTQVEQFRNALQNSVRLDQFHLDRALTTVRGIEDVLRQGRNVSYAMRDLERNFRGRYRYFADTFNAFQGGLSETALFDRWSDQSQETIDMALGALKAAQRQSEGMTDEAAAMQAIADQLANAEGRMDALQAVGELSHHGAQQMMKMRQLAMVQVELAASEAANLQRRLDDERAQLKAWAASKPAAPVSTPNSSASYYRARPVRPTP